jgi:hypothetical protein
MGERFEGGMEIFLCQKFIFLKEKYYEPRKPKKRIKERLRTVN